MVSSESEEDEAKLPEAGVELEAVLADCASNVPDPRDNNDSSAVRRA